MRNKTGIFTFFTLCLMLVVGLAWGDGPASVMAQDGDDADEMDVLIEISGTVESIDEDGIVIGGVLVAPAGAFQPSQLSVGDEVLLTGYLLPDGTLQAVSLTPVDDDDADDEADDDEADDDDADDEADDDNADDDSDACGQDNHPVVTALAAEFDLDYATVMGWVCDGYGLGEIARAMLIAEQSEDTSTDDVLDQVADGASWGEIMQDADVEPGSLAPGRVISAQNKNKHRNGDDTEDDTDTDTTTDDQTADDSDDTAGASSGGNPGRGNDGNPPGQSKDKDNNGNAGNPPGQSGNNGNSGGNGGNNGNQGNQGNRGGGKNK